MKHTVPSALIAITITLGCGGVVLAQPPNYSTIRLVCVWDYTLDGKSGVRSEISGETLISVTELGDGKISFYDADGRGSQFYGTISATNIVAEGQFNIGSDTFIVNVLYMINRFTGDVQKFFTPKGSDGIIHYGKCHTATKKF